MQPPKRPALGKGLSALIPDAPERARDGLRSRHRSPRAERLSSRAADVDDARLDELAASIRRTASSSRSSCAASAIGFRSSRANAGGAPRSAPASLRVPVVVRDVDARPRAIAARDGAHRKHPAREPEPDRRGARVSPPRRRVPADAGRDRRGRRQGSRDRREHAAPAEAARGGPQHEVAAGALSMGHARALLALDRRSRRSCSIARDVIARSLSVRETEALVKKIARERAPAPHARRALRRSRPTCTHARRRSG